MKPRDPNTLDELLIGLPPEEVAEYEQMMDWLRHQQELEQHRQEFNHERAAT